MKTLLNILRLSHKQIEIKKCFIELVELTYCKLFVIFWSDSWLVKRSMRCSLLQRKQSCYFVICIHLIGRLIIAWDVQFSCQCSLSPVLYFLLCLNLHFTINETCRGAEVLSLQMSDMSYKWVWRFFFKKINFGLWNMKM